MLGWTTFPIRKKARKFWKAAPPSLYWAIRKERNTVVFENESFSSCSLKQSFIISLAAWAGLIYEGDLFCLYIVHLTYKKKKKKTHFSLRGSATETEKGNQFLFNLPKVVATATTSNQIIPYYCSHWSLINTSYGKLPPCTLIFVTGSLCVMHSFFSPGFLAPTKRQIG